jgi:hypothetical protein
MATADQRHQSHQRAHLQRAHAVIGQVQNRGVGAAVVGGDADQNVVFVRFGVLDEDIKVAIVGEDACIQQFVLKVLCAAATVFGHQIAIREGRLRIFVEHLQDRVAPVPQGYGEADPLIAVADPGQPVLVPAVDAAASVIVGEGIPRCAMRAVVFAASGTPNNRLLSLSVICPSIGYA